ncbi:MAG: hypothetical protein ACOYVK_00445 [Bacillota bacterium]
MTINKKNLEEMMKNMGNMNAEDEQMKKFQEMSHQYEGKKEDEIMEDLKQLNSKLKQDKEKYNKQMEMVEQLKGFLDNNQKKKLEKIMKAFQDNEDD